ncbi:putative 2-dehydropantoate 2-reductase [Primulina huaijiensis]|uniref:putative 2-dehydropantoate 2-reductase n=1 Tax=Primulina huaijiensis TaxID=1492673 RepID=UPI003CC75C33
MEAPVILFSRNNGWAISTPVSEQFRSDGIVVRGQAYGVRSIRAEGNDAFAVFSTVHVALKMAIIEIQASFDRGPHVPNRTPLVHV